MQSPSAHLQLQGPHWIIQPGGQLGQDSKKEQLGWLLMSLLIRLPSCWLAFAQGWGGNVRSLLLAGVAVTGGG